MDNRGNIPAIVSSIIFKNGVSSTNESDDILIGHDNRTELNLYEYIHFQGAITGDSTLNISGNSTFQGLTTGLATLNISGNSTLQGPITGLSTLNISGNSTFQGSITGISTLNISGNSTIQGSTTILTNLNVTSNTIIQNASTINSTLNISDTLTANRVYQNHLSLDPLGLMSLLVPIGSIMPYSYSVTPAGWLACDGSVVSRVTYNDLFNVISTIYGVGNGINTFNLPDLRGKLPIGSGQGSGLTNRVLGVSGGSETHTLSINEIPSHNHGGTLITTTDGTHSHGSNADGNPGLLPVTGNNTVDGVDITGGEPNVLNYPIALDIYNSGSHNHQITLQSNGGGLAHNIMHPYLVINYIIKY